MNFKILAVLVMLLFMPLASAANGIDFDLSVISREINKIVNVAKTLSIPGIGSVTIACDQGATCGQPGENWLVTMNSMSTAQTIDLKLPAGTKSISGDLEVTTQGTVTVEVKEKAPVQTVPVILNTNYIYRLRDGVLGTMNEYRVNAYDRAGVSSVITTNYDVQLLAPKGNSPVKSVSYDYRSPQTLYLYDGAGNMATIKPSHQISGGFVADTASVIYVDNGYGTWQAFDKVNFKYYLDQVNGEVQWVAPWNTGSLPKNWAGFLARMKELGLNEFTDLPITKSGNNVILTYPVGSIGTQIQAIIPKTMALSVTVRQHWGEPVIDSVDLSPPELVIGQGQSTLTVKVTNKGSTDTINVAAVVNGAVVTSVVNSLQLSQGQQGTYTFLLNPTITVNAGGSTGVGITVTATAGGSGLQGKKLVTLIVKGQPVRDCSWFGNCPATTQRVIVTVYNPDQSVLNAPIFKNNVQVGTGRWEAELPIGTYIFSSNNASNLRLFAPVPVEVELKGGEPKIVSLYFSTVPPAPVRKFDGEDMTWIFWLAVILIIAFFAQRYGWYANIWFWFGIIGLYLAYEVLKAIFGLVDTVNEFSVWDTLGW